MPMSKAEKKLAMKKYQKKYAVKRMHEYVELRTKFPELSNQELAAEMGITYNSLRALSSLAQVSISLRPLAKFGITPDNFAWLKSESVKMNITTGEVINSLITDARFEETNLGEDK